MSKISRENKAAKSKQKNNPEEGEIVKKSPKQKTSISGIPNVGKCCTCKNFPAKIKGCTQPCKILKSYVARKAEHPECYKCKFES